MNKIENLLKPQSIAVIGASTDKEKIGYQILNNLIEGKFDGKIYPVNPKADKILDLKVYPEVTSIDEPVDLAVIVIPAPFVGSVLKQCAEKNVKSVIVITAGFAEAGEEGARLQKEIVEICNNANITMLGPNCLGLINTHANLNASFAQIMPKRGNISLISQSGAMITALIDWSRSAEEGFSKVFSMGNKADIKEEEVLEYLYNDPETSVIIAYLEQLNVTPRLTEVFSKYSKTKPTIVLFGGKTSFGASAASSHTGAIISSYLAIETYLKQAGAIVVSSLSELFSYCQLFSNLQKINDKNIAIITNAGGPGIITCDELFNRGLNLAKLSDESKETLKKNLRPFANTSNPIDILGDATEDDYKVALEIADNDSNVDGIIVLLTPQSSTNVDATAEVIASHTSKKPVVTAFIGGEELSSARNTLEKSGKPSFKSPDEAVSSLKALFNFSSKEPALLPVEKGNATFTKENREEAFVKFDLPVLTYKQAENIDDLKTIAREIGYPVVLKTAKPEIIHKSDSGGVKLNIQNDQELEEEASKMGFPVIIGKMVKGKHEIFMGIKKDESIGTLVAFGTGGIYSELYKDLSYRVAPISHEVAKEMIKETKMGAILGGARGQDKYDLDKLANIIVNSARFADEYDNIKEIDFNPLIASFPDFYIVDARIIES